MLKQQIGVLCLLFFFPMIFGNPLSKTKSWPLIPSGRSSTASGAAKTAKKTASEEGSTDTTTDVTTSYRAAQEKQLKRGLGNLKQKQQEPPKDQSKEKEQRLRYLDLLGQWLSKPAVSELQETSGSNVLSLPPVKINDKSKTKNKDRKTGAPQNPLASKPRKRRKLYAEDIIAQRREQAELAQQEKAFEKEFKEGLVPLLEKRSYTDNDV